MPNTAKSFLFALALCVICGTLLSTAAKSLKTRQQQNMITDRRKNVLKSVDLIDENRAYTPKEINALFSTNIKQVKVDDSGRIVPEDMKLTVPNLKVLPIYLYVKPDGTIVSYIIPIDTQGLWGKIHGYLSIKDDGSTIQGFTVYQHSETPGLGGEIEKNWFEKNFMGKKIVNRQGSFVSIEIAKGKVGDSIPKERQANYVDGISGATLTGKYLTIGLKETLSEYEPISIRFRHHNFTNYAQIEKSQNTKKVK